MDKYYISWLGSAVLDTPAKWTELLPLNTEHFEQLSKVEGVSYRPIFYDAGSVGGDFRIWPASRNYLIARVWKDDDGEERLAIVKTG